jgi:soluble lytic murein transglycosylase-like protein
MRGTVTLAALVIVGAAAYYAWPRQAGEVASTTAGDEESNSFLDAVDTMTSKLTGWPAGSGPYQETIAASAAKYNVPVMLLAWLLWKESRYNPAIIDGTKRSAVGAMGIAQFMPATAQQELGSVAAALDPWKAIPGAARYLGKLYNSAGSWAGALAAYNWGIGNVQRKGIALAPPETVDYYTTILARAGIEEMV